MAFSFSPYKLSGLLVVEGKSFPDERGYFMESYRDLDFAGSPIPRLLQDNLSRSKKGVLRGLHYQKAAKPVGKLVRCVRGRIFDVAVDIRKGSPTYGKWASLELSDEGNRMFWVPPGFAHGFYTLSEEADVLYKVTDYWAPEVDRGIRWNCPEVAVQWPDARPLVAAKDEAQPVLSKADNDFVWP